MIEASTTGDALALFGLSDDGYVFLDGDGLVVELNSEAERMLGASRSNVVGHTVENLANTYGVWRELAESVMAGNRRDFLMTLAGGRRALVSLRRKPHSKAIELIKFCDLEAFDYRRQVAQGREPEAIQGFMANNRTRPDFEVQRTLSPELHRVLSRGERAIQRGARILITGESGVGKSEIARFLHSGVARASDPFVSINCATASSSVLGEALFGREDGREEGAIFRAAGGTLFLDEVAELPLELQVRLLGFLEDSILDAPEKHASIAAGPRLIAATNRDLRQLMRDGQFRPDLYFRLAVVELDIPPLRKMPTLIQHLADRFLLTMNRRRKTPVALPERFRQVLEDYSFPGNIRELVNIIQKASIFIEDTDDMEELTSDLLTHGPVLPEPEIPEPTTLDLKTEVRRFELALIDKAIRVHGSKRKAAKALGVDIGTVSRKTTQNSPRPVE